jgi:hypothetical protein
MDDTADVDTHAFLQSVRELKEKRQREDNERQEQLEAQIATSRLARKLGESISCPYLQRDESPTDTPHRARTQHGFFILINITTSTSLIAVGESTQGVSQQRSPVARQHPFASPAICRSGLARPTNVCGYRLS